MEEGNILEIRVFRFEGGGVKVITLLLEGTSLTSPRAAARVHMPTGPSVVVTDWFSRTPNIYSLPCIVYTAMTSTFAQSWPHENQVHPKNQLKISSPLLMLDQGKESV